MTIGDTYQGGIIVYILQPGDLNYSASTEKGIIVSSADVSSGVKWYNGSYGVKTSANDKLVRTGSSNTTKIVNTQGAGSYAAQVCQDLVLNTYTDWQLPSIEELKILYSARGLTGTYWSSTEFEAGWNYVRVVSSGQEGSRSKNETHKVRAVRYY
jgi:hypothetical protein